MSLRKTVQTAMAGAAIGCVTVVIAMSMAYFALDKAQSRLSFASNLIANVSRLNLLSTELINGQSLRIEFQWKQQHANLVEALQSAPPFESRAEVLLGEIRSRLESSRKLTERASSLLNAQERSVFDNTAIEILIPAIHIQSNAIFARATEIHSLMTSAAADTRGTVLLSLGGLFLVILVGGGFFLLLLCTDMLAQILRLRSTIRKIAHGDMETEIPDYPGNEIGDVFRDLDRMRRSLLETMSELGQSNLKLISTKATLEDRTASLQAANTELEAFASAVSHDLRAPLRTVSGFTQAVLEDYGDQIDAEGKSMLTRIHGATRHMYQLIEDILYLSKIGQSPLEISEIDISRLVTEIFDTIREEDPARDVELSVEPGIKADCDRRLIRIALGNILQNAWKFTARTDGARIEFGESSENGTQILYVHDNGAGFDMAFKDNLFKPFKRLHSAAEFPGTGIGLATVNRIIGLHGGKIWGSSAVGKGATFCFALNKANVQTLSELPAPASPSEKGSITADKHRFMPLRKSRTG
ncbi:MAG: ATP-binding protein [Rhodomicrobiaceae bacterium]